MKKNSICRRHRIDEDSDKWQVVFDELTDAEDEHCESFEGSVCPVCFHEMREKYRKARRSVQVESRASIRLRTENDRLNEVLEAVVGAIKEITGEDPMELAQATYKSGFDVYRMGAAAIGQTGDLKNILPNLIVAASHKETKT